MGRSADIPRSVAHTLGDDTDCPILHVDMDAFFASVEIQRRPELRGKPVVVGGGTRGVVAAASYEARRYGVRSAMAMSLALRRCPQLVVVPPDREAYRAVSDTVMAILRDVTPAVEPLSLDEAFLDVRGSIRLHGRPSTIAEGLRARVFDALGLRCSVGVASTKFIAKLASARCKPDGLLVVPAADTLQFLHPLPVTVLWGVGARTAEPLHRLGVRTVGDLLSIPPDALRRAVGAANAEHLHELAHGRDQRQVRAQDVEKSISADHTTEHDLTGANAVLVELLRLSDEVGRRVRSRRMRARTVGIKVRFADFTTVSRVRTLAGWTDSTSAIHAAAGDLYRSLDLDRPRIRLVGVKLENLCRAEDVAEQLTLDLVGDATAGIGRADAAADLARARFGETAVGSASLLAAHQNRSSANFRRSETARMLDV